VEFIIWIGVRVFLTLDRYVEYWISAPDLFTFKPTGWRKHSINWSRYLSFCKTGQWQRESFMHEEWVTSWSGPAALKIIMGFPDAWVCHRRTSWLVAT
jgi:hypothetical protein